MTHAQWLKKNSTEYKGFVIYPGSVCKNGEIEVIFYAPINASADDIIAEGKRIIDDLIRKTPSTVKS